MCICLGLSCRLGVFLRLGLLSPSRQDVGALADAAVAGSGRGTSRQRGVGPLLLRSSLSRSLWPRRFCDLQFTTDDLPLTLTAYDLRLATYLVSTATCCTTIATTAMTTTNNHYYDYHDDDDDHHLISSDTSATFATTVASLPSCHHCHYCQCC